MPNTEKMIRNWPHMAFAVLEVPPGPTYPGKRSGAVKLAAPLWAHFVDLYLGSGTFRIKENATEDEVRERAIRALESCWPNYPTMPPEHKALDGIGFVVKRGDDIMTPAQAAAQVERV
jgi:hypothetical protein